MFLRYRTAELTYETNSLPSRLFEVKFKNTQIKKDLILAD